MEQYTHKKSIQLLNRRILKNYWLIVSFYLLAAIINLFFTDVDRQTFFTSYVLYPTATLIVLLLLTELIVYKMNPIHIPYVLVSTGAILVAIIISYNYTARGIESLLLIPIMMPTLYFSKRLVWYGVGASLICYLALVTLHHGFFEHHFALTHLVIMLVILVFSTIIPLSIIDRGSEILQSLKQSLRSEQELMASKIFAEKLSKTDALTNLNNHRSLQEYLDHIIQHCRDVPMHLAVIDIDNFKRVNDTYGHQTGDDVLRFTADTLIAHVTADDFVARNGGEEFVIIFMEKTEQETTDLLQNIRIAFESTPLSQIDNESITVSLGVQSFHPTLSRDEWYDQADKALYTAKRTGKNKVIWFRETM